MRVVSGIYRSRHLKTLKGQNTRPTSDKIRGAIFDSITFDTSFKTMLDLFSGSGAMGIEALSRHYEFVYFNDKSHEAIKVIKENINRMGVKDRSKVFNLDYRRCIEKVDPVDLVFVDPPYDTIDYKDIILNIDRHHIVNNHGMIIVESSMNITMDDRIGSFLKVKEKNYKSTKVFYYRKDE